MAWFRTSSSSGAARRTAVAYLIGLLVVLVSVFASVKGFVNSEDDGTTALARPPLAKEARRFDASRFILNALLVPALDGDAVPLRWVDPRSQLRCRPGAIVRVNGVRLVPGALVPDAPFTLEWHAVD